MLSEPRAIFFHTEFDIPPIDDLRISKEQVRALYNAMCEPGGHPYENLDLQNEIPTLSTRRSDGESVCRLGGHRVIIAERNPQIHVGEFVEIVETVLGALGDGFPPFMVHRVRIQCLAQVNKCDDSIDLLADRVSRVFRAIQPFRRAPSFFGMRFRFLPAGMFDDDDDDDGDDDEADDSGGTNANKSTETGSPKATGNGTHEAGAGNTGDDSDVESGVEEELNPDEEELNPEPNAADEAFVTLRFETHTDDVKQVWMEAQAQFMLPLPSRDDPDMDLERITANIRGTYRFLTERGKEFLDQFEELEPEGDEE